MKSFSAIVKLIAVCTAMLCCIQAAFSQTVKADSAAVFSLIDRADYFFNESQYDSAIWYCSAAENLAKKKNYKKGRSFALIKATEIYIDKDDLVKAEQINVQTTRSGAETKDSLVMAVGKMQLAQIRLFSSKPDEAIQYFEEALKIYLADHPSVYTALAYNDLGYTYGQKADFSNQAESLLRSVSIYEKYFPEKTGELAVALSNLSTLYYTLNKKDKATEYAKRSLSYRLKLGDPEKLSLSCCNLCQLTIGSNNAEAEKYLQQCVKYALESKKENRIIHSYITAAYLYSTTKEQEKSLEYEVKAIQLLEKAGKDSVMLMRRYMAAGTAARVLKRDSSEILSWYGKSLKILNAKPDKMNLRDFYVQLYNYYYDVKNYPAALANYKKYVLYKDSLISEKTESSIADIAAKYETAKKDDEISKLSTEQKIKQLEIEKQKAMLAGNMAEAKQKQNEITLLSQERELQDAQLKHQGEELEKQLLLAKNNEQQLQLSRQEKKINESSLRSQKQLRNFMIAGIAGFLLIAGFIFNRYQLKKKLERQKEMMAMRNDIARDLHDDIGSTLTSIRILSEVSKNNLQKDGAKAAAMLHKITEQSAQMQQGMSDIVWAIKPDNDRLENMLIRMREYAAFALEPKNIKVSFDIDEQVLSRNIDMQQRRDVLMIYKEALNNAAKHSDAEEVNIKISAGQGRTIMEIKDNGKGFEQTTKTSSNGLGNIRTRAEALGGTASIISEKEKGTAVTVEIPAT